MDFFLFWAFAKDADSLMKKGFVIERLNLKSELRDLLMSNLSNTQRRIYEIQKRLKQIEIIQNNKGES